MNSLTSRPDFKDWLSPMLVKELRQGTRSRIFMAAFFLTQVLMILSTIFNLTAADEGDENSIRFLSGLFWFMIAVPILFLTPIRGFSSLHGELKERTMELVFLTRLSAWRITAGKWMALMVQTLLLVCGILPYVLLRYFLGGINIMADLQGLLLLIIASGVLTALTVALSPYESKLLRGLFVIGLFFGFCILLSGFLALAAYGAMVRSGLGGLYTMLALFVPAIIILFLEIGGTRIAPAAENHAIRKRLLGIYFVIAGVGMILGHANASSMINFVLVLLAVVAIDAMGEVQEFNRIIYRPFEKRGPAGRILALFFTPGWVSATWYVILLAVICGAVMAWQGEFHDPRLSLLRISYLGALIFPATLIRLWAPHTRHFLGFYIALQFFLGAIAFLQNMVTAMANQPASVWISPLPGCVFLLAAWQQIQPVQTEDFLTVTGLVTVASLIILVVRGIAPWRDIRAALRQSDGADV